MPMMMIRVVQKLKTLSSSHNFTNPLLPTQQ